MSLIGAKIALPLVGGLISPLLSLLIFKISRRRLRLKETLKSRAYLFYRGLSGVLLGQVIFNTSSWLMLVFALAGYLLMDACEAVGRAWNTNPNYIGLIDNDDGCEEIGVNKETMERETVVVVTGIDKDNMANTVWKTQDANKNMRKRRWMLGVLFVVFAMITVSDGFLTISKIAANVPAVVICFYINGIAMSGAIYGGMVHAHLQVEEEHRVLEWCLLTGLWSLMLAAASIPTILEVQNMAFIFAHPAYQICYGFALGPVLRLQQYYYNMQLNGIDKKELALGVVVFVVAAGQSALVGFFL
jgi:hypothetical protein